jgi:hypothetical protein
MLAQGCESSQEHFYFEDEEEEAEGEEEKVRQK